MKEEILEDELSIPGLRFHPVMNLHAMFDGLNDISGKNAKHESCLTIRLVCPHEISSSLEW